MLEREGDETCRVKDGNRLVTVNIRQLLSCIDSEAQRRGNVQHVTNIYVGGDVVGRDKVDRTIQVGDITDSDGVAIGDEPQAVGSGKPEGST
jgi:hypothetical protein